MAAPEGVKRVLYGVHPVEEALRSGARPVGAVYLAEGARGSRLRQVEELARARGVRIRRVDARTLERLAGGGVHQGVVAALEQRPAADLEDVLAAHPEPGACTLVVLDGVQDPRNLGAVVRNAALTGAAAVVVPKDRAAGLTPAVEKVAAGGLEHVALVRVGNLARALGRLKEAGFWVFGAAGEAPAEDLDRADFPPRSAVVFGEEHRGLRRLTRERCDRLVRIPTTGALDSFNLGTASGIILSWIHLRRLRARNA